MLNPATATLILGGARSGKSRHAQVLAERAQAKRIFIATAEPLDDEMQARIDHHRMQRGSGWQTIEAPLELVSAIEGAASGDNAIVVDCLTIWLSNIMHANRDIEHCVQRLTAAAGAATGNLFLVSNEVGMGIVPESPLGRRFRDEQGRLNQLLAGACQRVDFVAAGLPMRLKG